MPCGSGRLQDARGRSQAAYRTQGSSVRAGPRPTVQGELELVRVERQALMHEFGLWDGHRHLRQRVGASTGPGRPYAQRPAAHPAVLPEARAVPGQQVVPHRAHLRAARAACGCPNSVLAVRLAGGSLSGSRTHRLVLAPARDGDQAALLEACSARPQQQHHQQQEGACAHATASAGGESWCFESWGGIPAFSARAERQPAAPASKFWRPVQARRPPGLLKRAPGDQLVVASWPCVLPKGLP